MELHAQPTAFLDEIVMYGGLPTRRADVIADLQRIAPSQAWRRPLHARPRPHAEPMTRRIEFTVPDEKAAEYDKARGLIPLAAWIKAALDKHLREGEHKA